MAWIESHTVTLRHHKLIAAAQELRLKPVYFLGHLHALWYTTLDQREDGDLSSWNDDTIALAADYTGDAKKFVSVLLEHRWLDDARTIHDWLDYAGRYLIRKYNGRYRDRLVKIWATHGRDYGGSGKKVSSGSVNRPFTDQKLTSTSDGRSVYSKHSSEMEGREFFNAQVHPAEFTEAKRLVKAFYDATRSTYRSVKATAERQVAQLLLDEPKVDMVAIENGFKDYASQCRKNDEKACAPTTFFRERRWESFDGNEPADSSQITSEERLNGLGT